MMISLIALVGKNNELGKDNDLIWRLRKDTLFFKKMTWGKTVIMGKNTYLSLPNKLNNRHMIVISKTLGKQDEVEVYDDFLTLVDNFRESDEEVFVIGGAQIYKLFLPYAKNIYLTEVDDKLKSASVYFPKFNKEKYEKIVLDSDSEDNIQYQIVLYRRNES